MNENSIFFAVDKIEDKFIEEAAESAMEENSVQPLFVTPISKKPKKPIFAILGIAACFALIFTIGIAVSRNSGIEITQTLPPINTAATSTEATTTEVTTTETPETTPAQTTEENHHLMRPDNTKIDLFSSAINDMQGKEYEINVYMYHVDNGETSAFPIEEGMLRGYVAAELFYNGEKIYDREIVVGNVGQTGKKYYLPKISDYFKVLHLDGGDVFVCSYSNDDKLWINQFYVIVDGELKVMERYFSDEERKLIEEKTTGRGIVPSKAKYEFITTNEFTTDKNRIIYKLDFETSGMNAYSYEIGSYSPGEIPLIFDFENNTVRCEKEEYAGLVYSYFDID